MAKKKSGYQNRKAAKERVYALQDARDSASRLWLAQDAYRGTEQQWDPNAPPMELPLYGQPPPILAKSVQAALLQLEQGAWYMSAYLWDGMLRDDRIAAKTEERVDRLIGCELDISPATVIKRSARDGATGEPKGDPAPAPTAQTIRIAELLKQKFPRIVPSHQLAKFCRNAMALSVGVAQVISVEDSSGERHPQIKIWNNRYLRYDWLLRKYRLVTENQGEITIEPDDPQWIVYEPYGTYGWLDMAKIRALALPWLIRFWTREYWARYCEVHGQPIRLGIIPAERDPADEKLFLAQISRIGHEAVIRIPQGVEGNKFDVKLLEATSNGWEGFEKLLQHCDDTIAIVWLGQKQSTTGQGGLGSQENAGESTILRLVRKDAAVGEVLRERLIKPWTADNFGDPEKAPHIGWQIDPPEDQMQAAKADQAVSSALVNFKNAGAPINIRAYLERRGYPLLTEAEHDAAKAKAVEDARQAMVMATPDRDEDEDDESDNDGAD